ncbi:MAG: formylmethanofuran--tetrahydromethanopterin N-formyltransferase [Gammaproteobacteria bacterium]|nr:formylmethanofuran--tetrahydromethanopterin N-formyltransferase [Gammaproteobacteria bacterium]
MKINGVAIEDTFAEAFSMKATRLIITALNPTWAMHSARAVTGFATSVIACGCEAGIERELQPNETPDGRPGVAVLLFSTSTKELTKQLQNRVGQCVLTSPTSACFAGFDSGDPLPLGKTLRYFGDGYQIAKKLGRDRYWRVPVMDGEFLCQDVTYLVKAIGGGNFLILAETQAQALAASERAVAAMRKIPSVIMPFPGGVVRSGSKVGSKYKTLPASTNHRYCPTLKQVVDSALPAAVGAVLEIVIDGLTAEAINEATRAGIRAACTLGRKRGIVGITAGNYGGNLGPYHFKLREILK